jgi:integrase
MQHQPNQASALQTDSQRYLFDPTRRWPTSRGHRGISFRLNRKLERSYFVYHHGGYLAAGSTEAEALALQASFRTKKARGERVIVPSKVTFKEAAEEWFSDAERRLRPGTLTNYRSDLDRVILPRFGHRTVGSITAAEVVELITELEAKGKAESTIANALKPLSQTFAFAIFKELIPPGTNPVSQIPRGYKPTCNTVREHREWTTEEVDRLIAEARKLDGRPEARRSYALTIELLLRTGLRLGECLGLRFGDIDFTAGVLHVRYSWTKDGKLGPPKTASSVRRVPLAPELVKQLATRSIELNADEGTFVFASEKGANPPRQSNFRRRAWVPVVEAAGLTDGPKVTPHDARHAFASQLADLNLTSSDLAPILGHSTSGITEAIYTHAFNRDEREERVRQAMEAAMGGGDRHV